MAFMSLEKIFFEKKQVLLDFAFFVCLLPGFIIKRLHNTLPEFGEGAMKDILRAKVWLYGLESVFWQNLTFNFLFVVYLLVLFVTA